VLHEKTGGGEEFFEIDSLLEGLSGTGKEGGPVYGAHWKETHRQDYADT